LTDNYTRKSGNKAHKCACFITFARGSLVGIFGASYGGLWTIVEASSYFGVKVLENSGLTGHLILTTLAINLSLLIGKFRGILVIPSLNLDDSHSGVQTIKEQLMSSGITAFYSSRRDYAKYRSTAATIDSYISTARKSLVMVSINLMTGLPFHGMCQAIKKMLEGRDTKITVVISLLNPWRHELLSAVAPVIDDNAESLAEKIKDTLRKLFQVKNELSEDARNRF
jgi:hypothetical protein